MNKQAVKDLMVLWLGIIVCIQVIGYCMIINAANDINSMKSKLPVINELKSQIDQLKEDIRRIEIHKQLQQTPITEEDVQPEEILLIKDISRGDQREEPIKMKVTAYDLSFQSCRKNPDHPEYGITASGTRVKEWHTIAAGPELPFGTQVFIPYFQDKPNKGIFVVEDRGSAITNGCIDIYMPDYDDCMEFGVRELDVFILD